MKVGNIVTLKSGGPKMTVTYVVGSGGKADLALKHLGFAKGDVVTEWFDNTGTLQKSQFKKEALILDEK